MVTPAVMLAAAVVADSVSVLVPALLIGLNVPVTPLGKPGGEKLTVLALKPPVGVIVIVLVPLEPGKTVRLLGDAERVKLGTAPADTARFRVAV